MKWMQRAFLLFFCFLSIIGKVVGTRSSHFFFRVCVNADLPQAARPYWFPLNSPTHTQAFIYAFKGSVNVLLFRFGRSAICFSSFYIIFTRKDTVFPLDCVLSSLLLQSQCIVPFPSSSLSLHKPCFPLRDFFSLSLFFLLFHHTCFFFSRKNALKCNLKRVIISRGEKKGVFLFMFATFFFSIIYIY